MASYTQRACELLHVQVLSDIADKETLKQVYALGWSDESSPQITYNVVTPWFPSLRELGEFISLHMNQIEKAADAAVERRQPLTFFQDEKGISTAALVEPQTSVPML